MGSARPGEQALPPHSHSFSASKSIRAVRPLDQLTTSTPLPPSPQTNALDLFFCLFIYFFTRDTYIVQFKVKAAGVTHRVSVPVAPPQGGGGGLAVCTAGACASSCGLEEAEKIHGE